MLSGNLYRIVNRLPFVRDSIHRLPHVEIVDCMANSGRTVLTMPKIVNGDFVMSMLEAMLAAGGTFSEISVTLSNRENKESLRRVKLSGILSPTDMSSKEDVTRAIAASTGGTFMAGDVSSQVDGFTAAVAYNSEREVGIDVVDLMDVAIGGVVRDGIVKDAADCAAHLREQRNKIEAAAREQRTASSAVPVA